MNSILSLLEPLFSAVGAILTICSAWLAFKTERLKHTIGEMKLAISGLKTKISAMTDFIKTVSSGTTIDTNIVVLGPRTVGKSSLISAWTQVWQQITELRPTPVFENYEYIFPEFREDVLIREFGIERVAHVRARMLIWDYGGEEHLLHLALRKIDELKSTILLLILTCEQGKERINREYFSANFLIAVRNSITKSHAGTIERVFVIFSKRDLLTEKQLNSVDTLKQSNIDAISTINTLFGSSVSYHLVSAESGEGMAPLLRDLSACVVDHEGRPIG